jgi:hypothetical protein
VNTDKEFDAHLVAVEAEMAFAKATLPFGGGQWDGVPLVTGGKASFT